MLALALGGRTIAEWQASMSRIEFLAWIEFYRKWPFDDHHRINRPAALIASRLGGAPVTDLLEWLEPPEIPEGMSIADYNTMRAFGEDPFSDSEA